LTCLATNQFLQIISNICYLVFKDPVLLDGSVEPAAFSLTVSLATRGESNGVEVLSQAPSSPFFQKKISFFN